MQQQQLRRIDPDSSSILGSGADDTRLQYISDTSNYDSTSNNSNPSPSSVLDRYFDIMTSPPPPPPLHSVQQSPKNDQVASVLSASDNDLSRPVSTNSIIGAYGNILSPPSRPTSNRSFGAVLDDGKQQPSRLSQTAIDNKPQSPIAPSIAKPKPPVPQRPLRIPSHLGSSNTINSNTQETSNSGDYSPSAISFYTGGDNNRASNISRQQYSTSNVVTSDADAVKISSYYNASNGALEDSPLGTPTNDEIDYTKSATKEYEEERQAELDYRKQVKQRQSVIIKYEHATLEDFEGDMQNLVEDLEKIMKGFGTVAAVSATPIAPNVTEQNQSSKSSYESLNDTRILGDSTNVLESIDNVQQVTSVVSVSEEKRSKRPPPPPPPSNPPPARRTSSRRSAKSNNTETINDLQAPQMSQTTHPFILQQMQSHQLPSQTPVAREDAVPLGQLYGTANIVNTSNSDNVAPSLVESNSIQQTLSKLAADPTNIKKLTVQVYVNDHNVSRPMVVNSLTTSHQLVQDAKRQRLLTEDGDADDWTLFEAVDELGIERPLRDFELVMEVIETWGQESSNILLLKRYAYRQSLTLESAKEGQSSRMAGWLYVETKPGRWNNRYCQLNSNGIFYSKDQKGKDEVMLAPLASIDVYMPTRIKKNIPTKYCFSVKRQEPAYNFEQADDMLKYLCAESVDGMREWVLGIRQAKSQKILEARVQAISHSNSTPTHPRHAEQASVKLFKTASASVIPNFQAAAPFKFSQDAVVEYDNIPLASFQSNPNPKQKRPVRQYGQKRVPAEMMASGKPLIDVIDTVNGKIIDKSGEPINKTQFGDNGGRPLVPLNLEELDSIPGVDVTKYQRSRQQQKKQQVKACGECGCTDFARIPNNETKCANCFHFH